MTAFVTMKVPAIGRIKAPTVSALVETFATARDEGGYGASDIGGQWNVTDQTGAVIGRISYNGRWWPTEV